MNRYARKGEWPIVEIDLDQSPSSLWVDGQSAGGRVYVRVEYALSEGDRVRVISKRSGDHAVVDARVKLRAGERYLVEWSARKSASLLSLLRG